MSGVTQQQSLSASISNLAVRTLNAYTGRGPTKAWTSIDTDLITIVLQDTLTKGERSLLDDGRRELVLQNRKAYQEAMRTDLVEGIEQLSGRQVLAFLSDNHVDPDVAVESFVLAPERAPEPRCLGPVSVG